ARMIVYSASPEMRHRGTELSTRPWARGGRFRTEKDKPLTGAPHRTAGRATLSGVLGGWSAVTFTSTLLTRADLYRLSRGNLHLGRGCRRRTGGRVLCRRPRCTIPLMPR